MKQDGFAFINIIWFLAGLGLLGLYITVGEPILVGFLEGSTTATEGTSSYAIILGAPILILLASIYVLTKPTPVGFS